MPRQYRNFSLYHLSLFKIISLLTISALFPIQACSQEEVMITWQKEEKKEKAILLGAEFSKKNLVGLVTLEGNTTALALSFGVNTHDHIFGRANEDSIGAIQLKNNRRPEKKIFLAVAADSHYGGLMSDAVIHAFIDHFDIKQIEFLFNNSKDRKKAFRAYVMDRLFYASRESLPLLERKTGGAVGATTVICALAYDSILYTASIGDSVLYLKNKNLTRLINSRQGEYYSGLASPEKILETRLFPLDDGATLILATDGLPECRYGQTTLKTADVAALTSRSAVKTVKNLITTAFTGGGEDNIGVIVHYYTRDP